MKPLHRTLPASAALAMIAWLACGSAQAEGGATDAGQSVAAPAGHEARQADAQPQAAARPPIEDADAWLAGLTPQGGRRLNARVLPLAAAPMFRREGDDEPYEYRLYPPNLPTPPQGDAWAVKAHHHWAYIDEPLPAVRWMEQSWTLAALASRWGQEGEGAWSWQDARAVVLDDGRRQWLCFDAPYAGLARSGLGQYVRAVLVVSPAKPRQELFWSGLLASCERLAQDQARRWVVVEARPAGAAWHAQAWRIEGPGRRTALQQWRLEASPATPLATPTGTRR